MKIEKIKKEISYLKSVIEKLDKFDKVKVNDDKRNELKELLKELTSDKFKQFNKGNMIILCLNDYCESLSEIAYITCNKGIISVDTWKIWKVIYGLQEQIEEYRAYQNELIL